MSGDDVEERTLEVLMLPAEVDEELLSLYFENRRRSGGGPLESVKKKDRGVVLVFEDAEAAARVLSQGRHVLHNMELNVRRPPSKDRRRLLLRGVRSTTSLEMVELYVENMMGVSDYRLLLSPRRDAVLVQLSQPLPEDFQTLSSKISRRTLDGVHISLEQVDQTDCVLVEKLHPSVTADMLTLYFESEHGGNQEVKEVVMMSEGAARVSFTSFHSVDAVLDLQHRMNDADLVVKAFFDFLQPLETETDHRDAAGTTSEDTKDTAAGDGAQLAVKTSASSGVLEDVNHPEDVLEDVNHPEDVLEDVNHPEDVLEDVNHPEDVLEDVNHPEGVLEDVNHPEDVLEDVNHPEGVLEDVNHPEDVLEDVNHPEGVLEDVNHPEGVLEDVNHPEGVLEDVNHPEDVLEDHPADAELVLCHIPVPEAGKRALFQRSIFQQDVQKAHPDLEVQSTENGVSVAGRGRPELEELKHEVSGFLDSMVEARFTPDEETTRFLSRPDVQQRLLETIGQSGSLATYVVLDSDVIVTALSQTAASQACSTLKSQVCRFSIPVDAEYECMLYCGEWSQLVEALDLASVKVAERGGTVHVLTLKGMENETQAAILQFLTTPTERETIIAMEPGVLKYIQVHCHQLLADMDQVSIFPLEGEDVTGLKIHGHTVACHTAEEVLNDVVSSICTRTITVKAPGVTRFLDVKDCRSILNEMEAKFKVYINIKCVPWEPLPHQDIFNTAWQLLSQKNFQKVTMDGSTADLKSDSATANTNQAQSKGLLEAAKRIVSAVDEQQQGVVPPDQTNDVEDLDLYTAEETQESHGATVEASHPSADRDQASASPLLTQEGLGLSSHLEEEAQLSLAIQYSMESSQSTMEDEEEQLQKALELSRKMIRHEHITDGPKQQKVDMNTSIQEDIQAANTLQLDVFAGYSCDLIRVDIAFGKRVSQRQVEEKVEHRSIRNMSDYHHKCLEMIKRKHAVEVQVQGTIIAVSGFKDFVHGAMCDLKLLLDIISGSVSDREILKTVQWARHDPVSPDPVPYSADATVFLENSWRRKLEKVDVLLDNQPHVIDFTKMEEYNVAAGKSVKISRSLPELDSLTQDITEEEYSLLSNFPEATKIQEESEEFQSVVKRFYETIHEYHSRIRIVQIEKLMNRLLFNQYKLKKASVLQHSSHPETERTLYHGTSEASVKEICVHGFNRSFCGKNATVYGQGVYFAVNSALSVQDQYSPPNADGYKYVFVSKVLTGDFTKGDHSMKTAPLKESGEIPLRYDSVTDDITKPTMFVIFNDTQAFPEYLVTCQRIHR